MSTGYHEQNLSAATRTVHRALASLMEELEAADWYSQRMDVNDDDQLNAILQHNRDEEIEHAAMTLEWLRRNMDGWDEELRTYLFQEGPIIEIHDDDH